MGLGREVDDGLAALGGARNHIGIADRPSHEPVAAAVVEPLEVLEVAGVCQRVENRHFVDIAAGDRAPDEARADEPRATCNEKLHQAYLNAS